MTTADRLNDLITAKEDMKSAIIEKGVTPEGGLSTYADAIRQIEGSGSGGEGSIKLPDGTKFMNSTFTNVPFFDTSAITDMSQMFYNCYNLVFIPLFDTSNVTNMYYMFYMGYDTTGGGLFPRSNLISVPLFDTSNVTNMACMFCACDKLTEIPAFNTSKVQRVADMFDGCRSLTTIPELDFTNVDYMSGTSTGFLYGLHELTNVGGFRNLGYKEHLTGHIRLSSAKLTTESIRNIFNLLYDRATAGYSIIKIYIDSNAYNTNNFTDELIAIATSKGWNVSVLS